MNIQWKTIKNYKDIKYESGINDAKGINKITINRPKVRNAFRPKTDFELKEAFELAREDQSCGVIVLTGEGKKAFCSGGDQTIRGDAGYVGEDGVPRLNILDVQKQIRYMPKPIIAMVAGYAVGGGHVLHMLCDLPIASDNVLDFLNIPVEKRKITFITLGFIDLYKNPIEFINNFSKRKK